MIYLFGMITLSYTFLIPTVVQLFSDVRGGLQRIETFLKAAESSQHVNKEDITLTLEQSGLVELQTKPKCSHKPLPFLNLHDVTCKLSSKMCRSSQSPQQTGQDLPLLKNINLEVSSPELLLICGAVGSGKSSLLEAILGELLVTNGSVNYFGKFAYVSDSPWVFPGTIRDNIIFGLLYNERKYNKIIEACQLKKDFDNFPEHDLTRIGEHCASISGGQRTRIALARAVYSEADIYLLDDPLSSLDINVAENVFRLVIILILIVNTWIFNRSLKS